MKELFTSRTSELKKNNFFQYENLNQIFDIINHIKDSHSSFRNENFNLFFKSNVRSGQVRVIFRVQFRVKFRVSFRVNFRAQFRINFRVRFKIRVRFGLDQGYGRARVGLRDLSVSLIAIHTIYGKIWMKSGIKNLVYLEL